MPEDDAETNARKGAGKSGQGQNNTPAEERAGSTTPPAESSATRDDSASGAVPASSAGPAAKSGNDKPGKDKLDQKDKPEDKDKSDQELATEKPVLLGAMPTTTEYVVTVDNISGLVEKIEKMVEDSKRQELSKAEYAALGLKPGAASLAAAVSPAVPAAGYGSSAAPAALEAYYRGVADYIRRLTGY